MSAHVRKSLTVPLQCLLKQRHLYKYAVTGRWNPQTRVALRAFQRRVGQPVHSHVTRSNWVTLLTAGNGGHGAQGGSPRP